MSGTERTELREINDFEALAALARDRYHQDFTTTGDGSHVGAMRAAVAAVLAAIVLPVPDAEDAAAIRRVVDACKEFDDMQWYDEIADDVARLARMGQG
jgi:hypothetical protein